MHQREFIIKCTHAECLRTIVQLNRTMASVAEIAADNVAAEVFMTCAAMLAVMNKIGPEEFLRLALAIYRDVHADIQEVEDDTN